MILVTAANLNSTNGTSNNTVPYYDPTEVWQSRLREVSVGGGGVGWGLVVWVEEGGWCGWGGGVCKWWMSETMLYTIPKEVQVCSLFWYFERNYTFLSNILHLFENYMHFCVENLL